MHDGFKYLISLCSERHKDFDLNKTKMPWDFKKVTKWFSCNC